MSLGRMERGGSLGEGEGRREGGSEDVVPHLALHCGCRYPAGEEDGAGGERERERERERLNINYYFEWSGPPSHCN